MPVARHIVQTFGKSKSLSDLEYEEWLSPEDATFCIGEDLSLALDAPHVRTIAQRAGCSRILNDQLQIQRGPFVEVCRKIYFPDIPPGWKMLTWLAKSCKVERMTAIQWASNSSFKCQKFQLGLQEVWFAEEKGFRRYYEQKRNSKWGHGAKIWRIPFGKKRAKRPSQAQ
jgi:hypothetical protein